MQKPQFRNKKKFAESEYHLIRCCNEEFSADETNSTDIEYLEFGTNTARKFLIITPVIVIPYVLVQGPLRKRSYTYMEKMYIQ
jgi:hypothetical protein